MKLVAILDSVYGEDQKYRLKIGEIEKEFGKDSDEMKTNWKIIIEKDSLNLIVIQRILDERGWLGSEIIGEQVNSTLFSVIQHSKLDTQVEYLPMMRDAVSKENAKKSNLAILEDRIAVRQGKRQIYGSQIGIGKNGEYFVRPLIDPKNVDKRRAEVGLETIENYVKYWGIVWDVGKHIATSEARLKEFREQLK